MLSPTLHQSIQRARDIASEQHNAYATPEHLLLALVDDPDAAPVMRASNVDTERLRRAVSAALLASTDDAKPEQATVHPDPRLRSIIRRAVRRSGGTVSPRTGHDALRRCILRLPRDGCYAAILAADRMTFEVPAGPDDETHQTRSQVVLLNDIYTPVDLVIYLLTEVFSITADDAANIVLSTHRDGAGLCGTWSRAEARSLAERVMARAREFHHPLRCVTVRYRGGRAHEVTSSWLAWLDRQVWQAFDQRAR